MMTSASVFAAARLHMSGRFEWGVRDCLSAASDAWAALWGVDPIAAVRGAYSSLRGAARILRRAGGYSAWCGATFRAAGLCKTATAAIGSLALIACRVPFGFVAGLCLDPGIFATKGEHGVRVIRAREAEAWSWAS